MSTSGDMFERWARRTTNRDASVALHADRTGSEQGALEDL